MTDKGIKVTDKRMFTADGRLREEYAASEDGVEALPEAAAPEPAPEPVPPPPPSPSPAAGSSPRLEIPDLAPGPAAPSFLHLVNSLAEPALTFLGELPLPDGQSAENLEMARFYIDMLVLLRQKTAGNLGSQELAFLEDVLYQLRVRYVQKRG